jgi:hypothetical protein
MSIDEIKMINDQISLIQLANNGDKPVKSTMTPKLKKSWLKLKRKFQHFSFLNSITLLKI